MSVFVVACSPSDSVVSTTLAPTTTNPSTTTTSTTSTTTTTTTTTTTLPPTTTTTLLTTTTTTAPVDLPDTDAEVLIPDGVGPFPAVVLVHGGGWVAGSPASLRELARFLTEEGFLTVNTPYQLSNDQAGFPGAIDDVACAVRFAAAHPDSDGTVAVLGHSAGAHIGSVVALTGDQYAADCPIEGDGIPDRLVGMAGPYDVDRLGLLMLPFFGGGPAVEEEAWLAGNPHNHVAENTELLSLLLHGEFDGIVEPNFSFNFGAALNDAGSEALVEIVEGAAHLDLVQPEVVGDLIVTWLLR